MKMQANTVGTFPKYSRKDIYIIKNRINSKVYIGQSVNAAKRFISHCKKSSQRDGSLIDSAIQKYGANNFWFEILEEQVEDYNEREKYWIQFYNSCTPNGYNISLGGENPPVFYGVESPVAAVKSPQEVKEIKEELRYTDLSLSEIASRHDISKRTVLRINQGLHYEELDEEYPIRAVPNPNGKLTDEQVLEIIDILRYTYRQYENIAKQYGVSISAIHGINAGTCHPLDNIAYPIRRYKNSGKPACTYEQVTEISNLLATTSISCNQIAKCFEVDLQTVYIINNGCAKRYKRSEYKYPLRKHNTGRRPCIDYPR